MEICPFVVGRVVNPEEFHNRDRALRRLVGRLVSGQSTAIIGQPHIGKSSLLHYLLNQDVRQKLVGEQLAQSIFSYFDFQPHNHSNFDQAAFWKQVLTPLVQHFAPIEIIPRLSLPELRRKVKETIHGSPEEREIQEQIRLAKQEKQPNLSQTHPVYAAYQTAEDNQFGTFTLEQFFTILAKEGWQFVLFIDEFDTLLTHPVLNRAEFYGSLRSLASRFQSFTLVIASRRSLEFLNRETQKINPHGSPYFNVFTEIRLGPLPQNHAEMLLQQAEGGFGTLDRKFILQTSGRHPYLLQTAASVIWELHEEKIQGMERYKTASDKLYERARDHFADTWTAWTPADKKVVTIIALTHVHGKIAHHDFALPSFFETLSDYSSELRRLKESGTLIETEDGWRIPQEAFLWWWADTIKAIVRENSDFESWLCGQEMDGMFTKDECKQMKQTAKQISGALGKGASTLIESFAKGLGEGAGKAITGK